MKPKPRHHDPILNVPESGEQDLLSGLSCDGCSCPDFTRSIMGKLGYMRASEAARRRRRARRLTHRGVLGLAALIALVAGIQMFNQGPEARRPAELPIHKALEQDVQQRTRGLGNVIQIFRQITPPPMPQAKPGSDEPVEASDPGRTELPREAKGFRWI